jgi:hypothetical protein
VASKAKLGVKVNQTLTPRRSEGGAMRALGARGLSGVQPGVDVRDLFLTDARVFAMIFLASMRARAAGR